MGVGPSAFSQVKILHFHGPKLGRGLEVIAKCNLTAISLLPEAIRPHFCNRVYAVIEDGLLNGVSKPYIL